ncbi:MAG: formate dehydrogenase accessory protein FdhE [Coriobacteriales bacterium]|nr:formate dehydrogenase accessory protein FdhE [Coriobacteriales bacterium]
MDLDTAQAAVCAYRPQLAEDDSARLEFFSKIWEFQEGIKARVLEAGRVVVVQGAPLAEWYWSEKPLLKMAPLELDVALFGDALQGCAARLATDAGLDAELADALTRFDWAGLALQANGLADEAATAERDTAERDNAGAGSSPDAFIAALCRRLNALGHPQAFVQTVAINVALALRPLLEPTADALLATLPSGGNDSVGHKPLLCPVCGSQASASCVGNLPSGTKNGRLLFCSLCGMQWEFERIRCPRCGTSNQGKLHYSHIQGDEAHRLYLCDQCGGYTRTTFAQSLRVPFSFDVEDVVMARLDQIALNSQLRAEGN